MRSANDFPLGHMSAKSHVLLRIFSDNQDASCTRVRRNTITYSRLTPQKTVKVISQVEDMGLLKLKDWHSWGGIPRKTARHCLTTLIFKHTATTCERISTCLHCLCPDIFTITQRPASRTIPPFSNLFTVFSQVLIKTIALLLGK